MSTETDPPRLLDEKSASPARVRALLTAVRDDVGTEEQIHHVESRLAPTLWAPAPVAAPGGGVALTALKIGALVVVAATAGGSFWVGTKGEAPLTASQPARPQLVRPAVPAALPTAVPTTTPDTAQKVQPATPHPQSSTEVPPSESDLLTRAQAALGRDAAKALALAEQHQKSFPHGTLSQEREVIAIEALSRLGRTAEVKTRAARFLETYPGSAHKSKIQSLLGSQ